MTGRSSGTEADGSAGTIRIASEDLTILGSGAVISSSTSDAGNAGEIIVDATRINLDGQNSSEFNGLANLAGRGAPVAFRCVPVT